MGAEPRGDAGCSGRRLPASEIDTRSTLGCSARNLRRWSAAFPRGMPWPATATSSARKEIAAMRNEHPPAGENICTKVLPKAVFMTAVVMIKMCLGKLPKTW